MTEDEARAIVHDHVKVPFKVIVRGRKCRSARKIH